jgi:4-alpha-glucanotransferase
MRPVAAKSFASMNTHDTATFASFWDAADIDDQVNLGLVRQEETEDDRRYRQSSKDALVQYLRSRGWLPDGDTSVGAILRGCLRALAASPAEFVLVNLEDLWGERQPQNTPGTFDERPNWRRKARFRFEEFRQMPEVVDILRCIDEMRGH